MKLKSTLLFFLSVFVFNFSLFAQVKRKDSLALVDLYNSTNGANWINKTNWLTGPVSTWYGITVEENTVREIKLGNNNLNGTMPPSLGNISELFYLEFTGNQLTGNIPSSIGNLTNLYGLWLGNNQLSGKIPASLGNIDLVDLGLYNNQLSGEIPASLGNFTSMSEFSLGNNQLSGEIPSSLGNMLCGSFNLNNNQLTGNIPASLANLGFNSYIELYGNQLSGSVPLSFENHVGVLRIQDNNLTFDGIEEIVGEHPNFYYSPQKNIPINYNPYATYGKLSVYAGGTLSNNTYQWYKDNNLYQTLTGDSTFVPTAPGVYYVRVNNSVVPNLQLVSDNITIVAACASAPANTKTSKIKTTSATVSWSASQGAIEYKLKYKVKGSPAFTTINTTDTTYKLTGLTPNTNYVWQVKAECSLSSSAFTDLKSFTTDAAFAPRVKENLAQNEQEDFIISPNPATDNINLQFHSAKQFHYVITISDVQGRIWTSKPGIAAATNIVSLDVSKLSAGVYYLKLHFGNESIVRKFVKE